MNIQSWFPLGLTGLISLHSKGLSRVFSNSTVQKHQFFSAQLGLSLPWSILSITFSSVQLLSRVRLFATPWTAAHQASLSITNSQSLLKLMSIELVMPFNHIILCRGLHPPSILPQHQGLFKWVSSCHQVAKVLEFQLHWSQTRLSDFQFHLHVCIKQLSSVLYKV